MLNATAKITGKMRKKEKSITMFKNKYCAFKEC